MSVSSNTYILLANGLYKNITQIKPGEMVLNMYGEPVKVAMIQNNGKADMMQVRYHNWYTPLYCTQDLQCLVTRNEKENWTTASALEPGMFITAESVVHEHFPTDSDSILKPSFELGLLFGLYAGYGNITEKGAEFRFGPNDDLISQVAELLNMLFNAESTIEKDEYCYRIYTASTNVIELFSEFRNKVQRCIPQKYWFTNEEYVKGLFEGLVEYDPETDVSRYFPITTDMATVFCWVCSLLKITFENTHQMENKIYPLYVHHKQDNNIGKVTFVDTDAVIQLDSWCLQVNCPTNSFIANNLVIRTA